MAMLPKKTRPERMNERAEKKMVKAKTAYKKAEDTKKNLDTSSQASVTMGVDYANNQYAKSQRLGQRANTLKTKAADVKRKQEIKKSGKEAMKSVKKK
jgi:hypothetical protein